MVHLMTQGMGSSRARRQASSGPYSSMPHFGVGMPSATMTRFATALSMATPEARYPAPV